MQALILAAGMGKRLKKITAKQTKGMVMVNGVSLIERMIGQLINQGITRIIVVIGYEGERLKKHISSLNLDIEIVYIENEIYYKTNNIYSLYLAKDEMIKDDTVLLESDLIIEDKAFIDLLKDKRKNLALVDKYESWMDGTCLEIDNNDCILKFISGKEFDFNNRDKYYKTINIYKFSKEFSKNYYFPFMEIYLSSFGTNEYYESVIKSIVQLDVSIFLAKKIDDCKWYEIDDEQDLDIASSIFCSKKERLNNLSKRYGGYWRYPKLIDFCYLVNPYFPPQKMIEELKMNFTTLLTEYPSGMSVNSLIAGKNFGINEENIVVGNGAAELIKSLMSKLEGTFGFIRPTFEEYPNRYNAEKSICFFPDNENYEYNANDVINFFDDKPIDNLIIINPDNPTGNYIFKDDMNKLISWSEKKQIKLIIDESFVDFADEKDSTFIKQEILEKHKNLYVMKSISKSYGVPGIRLGILVSIDTELIDFIKKDVAIWNINSFGEYYLQIYEKYKNDYEKGLELFKIERKRFQEELSKIDALRQIPSQANYIMVEVLSDISAEELASNLLYKYDLLVKNLSNKMGGKKYFRFAVKSKKDNDTLVYALKNELSNNKN
ncbi:MAG: aminotransferase [Clostridiales bacterium]|nr:MAG: aminotransferase [Clostridiales bacterium]